MRGTFSATAVPRSVMFLCVSNSAAVAWIADGIKMAERLKEVKQLLQLLKIFLLMELSKKRLKYFGESYNDNLMKFWA